MGPTQEYYDEVLRYQQNFSLVRLRSIIQSNFKESHYHFNRQELDLFTNQDSIRGFQHALKVQPAY